MQKTARARKTVRVLKPEDFVIGMEPGTKEWFIYDDVSDRTICRIDSEEEAKEHLAWMIKNQKFYNREG